AGLSVVAPDWRGAGGHAGLHCWLGPAPRPARLRHAEPARAVAGIPQPQRRPVGIVTNGSELRLLRNNARSSRPSYVSVDLEAILDGNLYNEFALVSRLLHRSHLPADGIDAHDCLLERWYQQGI